MGKKLSAGVIFCTDKELLGCIPYGKKQLDIPKGGVDKNETPLQGAIRETREETGLDISGINLVDLGKFPYTNPKDLHLFLFPLKKLPPISQLKCDSYFKDEITKKKVPEVVGFEHVKWENISRFYPSLRPILKYVRTKLIDKRGKP